MAQVAHLEHTTGRRKLAIYKRGKTYWARWAEAGRIRRQSLGTEDRAEAERNFRRLQAEVLTVADVLKRWVAFQKPRRKPRSLHAYRIVQRRFTSMWGELRPEEITRRKVEETQEAMLAAKLAPRTVNHQVGLATAALKWAHDRDLTEAPPPKWKRLSLNGRSPRKYLTTTELERLFSTLREPQFERLRPVVMLAAYAGLRMGEIIALRWQDLDLDDGWIHIRPRRDWTPKTVASERSIPIAEELHDYLAGLHLCDRWVGPRAPGCQWNRRHLGVNVRRLFDAAGVDNEGPHTLHRLRGTFATEVLRASGDLRSLQAMLGHGNISVTSIYLAEVDEHKRAAVSGLSLGSRRAGAGGHQRS